MHSKPFRWEIASAISGYMSALRKWNYQRNLLLSIFSTVVFINVSITQQIPGAIDQWKCLTVANCGPLCLYVTKVTKHTHRKHKQYRENKEWRSPCMIIEMRTYWKNKTGKIYRTLIIQSFLSIIHIWLKDETYYNHIEHIADLKSDWLGTKFILICEAENVLSYVVLKKPYS